MTQWLLALLVAMVLAYIQPRKQFPPLREINRNLLTSLTKTSSCQTGWADKPALVTRSQRLVRANQNTAALLKCETLEIVAQCHGECCQKAWELAGAVQHHLHVHVHPLCSSMRWRMLSEGLGAG